MAHMANNGVFLGNCKQKSLGPLPFRSTVFLFPVSVQITFLSWTQLAVLREPAYPLQPQLSVLIMTDFKLLRGKFLSWETILRKLLAD